MKFVLRSDLGGRAADLPALESLRLSKIRKPMVLLAGGNGCGKSTLLAALRQATGLTGPGLGAFQVPRGIHDKRLPLPSRSAMRGGEKLDLARHLLMVEDRNAPWDRRDKGILPEDAIGVLDPVALGWTGQRIWLHDGREQDDHSIRDMELTRMRRSADDRARSHGQQMTGKLRYAVAWALGMFDLDDGYDAPPPDRDGYARREELVPREVFERLAGHRPDDPARNPERWLLLDEPETGLDPVVLARILAILAENAEIGRLRVICATHSSLAFELATHPSVQVLDVDGYVARTGAARRDLSDPARRAEVAAGEKARLAADCERFLEEDRGLIGQGRFTAHEAQGLYYRDAVIPPYGKADCLDRMRCAQQTDVGLPGQRRR
jgi:energy-coupling factor transporter ATP-binding protein EcfA2